MATVAAGEGPAIRPWRLSLSALQIVLPATVVLLALALLGFLAAVPALLGWLLALALSTVLASLREHRLLVTRQYLNQLAEGRDPGPPPSYSPLIDDGLDAAFRRLGHAFAAHNARVQEADRLLTALLDVLPDPLLVVGAGRLVLRANRAAADLFEHQPAGRPLEESLRDPGVLAGVDAALREQGEAQTTLHLQGSAPRAFAVHVLPVRVSERPVALLSLRELTEQLMIERMRSDFIANASHEIRTPLAALLGFIETLQGPAKDDAAARERFLVTMASEARRMARLVDDLLSLSRIESSAHQLPEGMADLAACAQDAVQALQPYAERRKVALEVEIEGGLPPIRADRDQIAQLLTNLIDNAIKYGGEGKSVRLAVDRLATAPPGAGPLTGRTAARIRVIDQGAGIAREHLPRLTERFFRVDPARSRALGGTGLGLAIVKHILRRHRGHIAIDSEPGRGTTVTVYLPST